MSHSILNLDISQEEASFFAQLEETLRTKSRRKVALMDFTRKVKSNEIVLSGNSYMAKNYAIPLLMPLLDCTKDEEVCIIMIFREIGRLSTSKESTGYIKIVTGVRVLGYK